MTKPDNNTVQFPSGRVATVAMIKYIQPLIKKRLGKTISTLNNFSKYQGNTIKITPNRDKKYWQNILSKPDDTILEIPSGKRFTVGDLKKIISLVGVPSKTSYSRKK